MNIIKCPYCISILRKHEIVCPNCNKKLPENIYHLKKQIRISVFGNPVCGRQNYIAVALEELKKKFNNKMFIIPMNFQTADIQKQCMKYLYKQKAIVPITNLEYFTPQLWEITDLLKYNRVIREYKKYGLCIYQYQGDVMYTIDETMWFDKWINGSDYIFFLIDSLQLNEVRKQLGKSEIRENSSEDLVERMAQYLRMAMGLPVGKRINKPVAVILTKFDEIMELMGNTQVTQENEAAYKGEYMQGDADAIDSEIRSWLESIGESYFLAALEMNFKKTRFFGVSSYGHTPLDGSVGTVIPHRVLDPILWVLSEEKMIK